MKKHTLILTLVTTLAAGSSLLAQTAPATASTPAPAPAPAPADAPSDSIVITPSFASQYMFRGTRLGGPSFQPSIEWDKGALALGVWANVPLKDKVEGQSDPEFDFYGSYSFDVIKDTATVVPGFTLYTYPSASRESGYYQATFEPNVAFNYSYSIFKFTPKVYYDVVLKGPTGEFTVSAAVPLKDFGTELDFVGTVGTFKLRNAFSDTSPDMHNWGDYYLVGVSVPFQVTKNSKLTLGTAYTDGRNNYLEQVGIAKVENTAAVSRVVFTVSWSLTL